MTAFIAAPAFPGAIEGVFAPVAVTRTQFASRTFLFGSFMLQPERQLLVRDGRPVRIGGRSLDILTTLVERPGVVVGKGELMERVWPATFVDEANLKANVALLRKALGERHCAPEYIGTVVGRGYRFIASVRSASGPGGRPENVGHARSYWPR